MVKIAEIDTNGSNIIIQSVKLTQKAFSQYGVAMSVNDLIETANQENVNQGSAIKLCKIAPCENHFNKAPSGHTATTNWNIFRCAVAKDKFTDDYNGNGTTYVCKVLEKHPYSTQTFVPMARDEEKNAYMVICAPDKDGKPDYENAGVFVAKGNQAVTYNTNVWHAPMIVLGKTTDFCVVTNENDVPGECCAEILFDPGFKCHVNL